MSACPRRRPSIYDWNGSLSRTILFSLSVFLTARVRRGYVPRAIVTPLSTKTIQESPLTFRSLKLIAAVAAPPLPKGGWGDFPCQTSDQVIISGRFHHRPESPPKLMVYGQLKACRFPVAYGMERRIFRRRRADTLAGALRSRRFIPRACLNNIADSSGGE
jgi:hypothetical protein